MLQVDEGQVGRQARGFKKKDKPYRAGVLLPTHPQLSQHPEEQPPLRDWQDLHQSMVGCLVSPAWGRGRGSHLHLTHSGLK